MYFIGNELHVFLWFDADKLRFGFLKYFLNLVINSDGSKNRMAVRSIADKAASQ